MDDRTDGGESVEYGIPPPRFRLHPETRPGRVRLQIADLDRSLSYYERVLGFRKLDRSERRASLGVVSDEVTLIELYERPGAAAMPRRGRLGLYHYAILLPARAELGRFARHLTEVGEGAGASDHLVSEALYLRDPDGLGIEVYSDRPRSEWRQRDGQLVMATEPLDMPSLVRAAGSTSWSGMPPGTTIGHIHLHVGDLEEAEAFYHEALGLNKVVWSYPGALFLSAGGYHHHLGVNTWATGAEPAGEGDARLLDWELLVPSAEDAERALSSMRAAGHAVERSPDGGVVRDPWGTALRIRAVATA
jgi:catechol 2,3-dioxygenase